MRRIAWHRRLLVGVLTATSLLTGCGNTATGTATSSPVRSPTPDAVTTKNVALVHTYWDQYLSARADGGNVCLQNVDPAKCGVRAAAILAVHQKFLSDLDTTSPPHQFAADDQVFRLQLPKAIADVKAMISASAGGDKQAVFSATTAYVADMIPAVTGALDHVDPAVTHD